MEILHKLSIGIVWLPMAVLCVKIARLDTNYILFLLFLLASALIDLIGYLIPLTEKGDKIYYPLHLIYLFVEGNLILFFSLKFVSWQMNHMLLFKRIGVGYILLFTLLIPLTLINGDWDSFINLSSIFSATLLIFFSFISAFGLLGLAEKNYELFKCPWFWILSGIFTYSFGSFFIDLLIPTETAQD
ncbi:MAG: hypothetical protein ABJC55_12150, partial [Algoriphagus sp.]